MAPARLPVRLPDGTVGGFVLVSTGSDLVEPSALEINRMLDAIRRTFPAATVAHALEAHEALLTWRGLTAEWGSESAQRKRSRHKRVAAEKARLRRSIEPCTQQDTNTPKTREAAAKAIGRASYETLAQMFADWAGVGASPLFYPPGGRVHADGWSIGRIKPSDSKLNTADKVQRHRRSAKRLVLSSRKAIGQEDDKEWLARLTVDEKEAEDKRFWLRTVGKREDARDSFFTVVYELCAGRTRPNGSRVEHHLTPLRARRLYECADPEKGRPEDDAEHVFLCSLAWLWWQIAGTRPTLTTGRVRASKGTAKNGWLSRFERFVRAIESAIEEPRPAVTRNHLERVVPIFARDPRPTE